MCNLGMSLGMYMCNLMGMSLGMYMCNLMGVNLGMYMCNLMGMNLGMYMCNLMVMNLGMYMCNLGMSLGMHLCNLGMSLGIYMCNKYFQMQQMYPSYLDQDSLLGWMSWGGVSGCKGAGCLCGTSHWSKVSPGVGRLRNK